MKYLGKITDPKDLITKEYVEGLKGVADGIAPLNDSTKVDIEYLDLQEITAQEVQDMWDEIA